MGAIIPNIAAGRFARFAELPSANDVIKWGILVTAGLVSDATLRDYATVTALLAGASDEATFTGYARQSATSVTVTVDNTNDRVDVDCADPVFSPTTAQAIAKIFNYYDPDTTAESDGSNIPMFYDDFAMTTPTSGTVTYTVASAGWGRATPA